MDDLAAARITAGLAAVARQRATAVFYRNYFDGNHPLMFASPKFASEFGALFEELCDNLCEAVVTTRLDRLAVNEYLIDDVGAPVDGDQADAADVRAATLAAKIAQVERANRLPQVHTELFEDTLVEASSYLTVWPAPDGTPRWTVESAKTTVTTIPGYGDGDWAVKVWPMTSTAVGTAHWRVTYWQQNVDAPGGRAEKFVTLTKTREQPTRTNNLISYEDGAEDLVHQYSRLPILHIPNSPSSARAGRSELKTTVPLQNVLNKGLCDLIVAGEKVALPQRYAVGVTPQHDASGNLVNTFKTEPGAIWGEKSKDARFGEFSAADLNQLVAGLVATRREIATVSGTPAHLLGLEDSSSSYGAALRVKERGIVSRVRRFQEVAGSVLSDAMELSLEMLGEPGTTVAVSWRDPQPLDEDEQADIAVKDATAAAQLVAAGLPKTAVWAKLGYTPDEIADMLVAADEEARAGQAAAAAAFNGGLLGGGLPVAVGAGGVELEAA